MSLYTPSEAIIICTRNRPSDLEITLRSIAHHGETSTRLLLVVDASDTDVQRQNRDSIQQFEIDVWNHLPYEDLPSSARQRNYGIEQLPPSVEIIHFIDDDVTIQSRYFDTLSSVFHRHPRTGGVGGIVREPRWSISSSITTLVQSFFLLNHPERGRVLWSGSTTNAQHPDPEGDNMLRETSWLNGCSSYRRTLLERHRFDESLTGYSMLEDLDLSFRISQEAPLFVHPQAQLIHRRSTRNRFDAERYSHALTVHRRWFVEKHFDKIGIVAYWWSLIGRLLALLTSSSPSRRDALRGLLQGIRSVWTRNHPLL
jgi:GT2 family glycosyltransferase